MGWVASRITRDGAAVEVRMKGVGRFVWIGRSRTSFGATPGPRLFQCAGRTRGPAAGIIGEIANSGFASPCALFEGEDGDVVPFRELEEVRDLFREHGLVFFEAKWRSRGAKPGGLVVVPGDEADGRAF